MEPSSAVNAEMRFATVMNSAVILAAPVSARIACCAMMMRAAGLSAASGSIFIEGFAIAPVCHGTALNSFLDGGVFAP